MGSTYCCELCAGTEQQGDSVSPSRRSDLIYSRTFGGTPSGEVRLLRIGRAILRTPHVKDTLWLIRSGRTLGTENQFLMNPKRVPLQSGHNFHRFGIGSVRLRDSRTKPQRLHSTYSAIPPFRPYYALPVEFSSSSRTRTRPSSSTAT